MTIKEVIKPYISDEWYEKIEDMNIHFMTFMDNQYCVSIAKKEGRKQYCLSKAYKNSDIIIYIGLDEKKCIEIIRSKLN